MNLANLLSSISFLIHDPLLVNDARIISSSFSRDRKISLTSLLDFLIFKHHNVLSEDISNFFNLDSMPCKQAMIKRMNILNFDIWDKILSNFVSTVYPCIDLNKLKDYIVIAVDGSFADLPMHPALQHYFEGAMNSKINSVEEIKKPQAKLSMIYDVKNKLILDFIITKYNTSEIPLLYKHLEKLESFFKGRKILLLADRYYGSAELFKYCEMHGYAYLVRGKTNFFKKYIANHDGEDDFDIHVLIDHMWKKRLKREDVRKYIEMNDKLNIRVVRNTFTYEETNGKGRKKVITVNGLYFTNLPGKIFTKNDIVNIYHHDRWCVEGAYDILKNQLNIEQLNTHNPIGIINEIMGKVIFYNIDMLVQMESNQRIEQKASNKYEYKTNNKNLIHLLYKNDFVSGFRSAEFKMVWINQLVDLASREKVAIRNGRHYKRWHKFFKSIPNSKHRIDGRRNPPVNVTKNGILSCSH